MRLTRRIERQLRDGKVLTVTRSWEVRFSSQGRGITLMGQQTGASVDAPAELAPLAEIERDRSTDGMWPILLSETGLIVAAGNYTREEDLALAVRRAEAMIARRGDGADARARHGRYLAEMSNASASLFDQLPPDLFFPSGKPHQMVRQVSLPSGETGEFSVTFEAEADPAKGWLNEAKRIIVTRLGESERRASEIWSMDAI